jgi:hypothetical protein
MHRASVCLAALWVAGGVVRADVAPPPGQQRVPVDHIIESDRAYPDYVFFVVIGSEADWSYRCDIGPGSPVRIAGANRGGRAQMCWLAAVPTKSTEGYPDEQALLIAIIGGKVAGALKSKVAFDPFEVRPSVNAPSVIERRHRIEQVSPDQGIVIATAPESASRGSIAERSLVGWVVVGVAVAAAVCGLGLWLRTRKRGPNPSS